MFRALLVFVLLFGSTPGVSLVSAVGDLLDPVAKVGNGWDPNGLTVENENDAESHWDPNG